VFAGALQYANEQGWRTVVDEYADDTLARVRPRAARPFDGLIGRISPGLAETARRLKLPLVNVWGSSPVHDIVPGVFPDYAGIGEQCGQHLVSRGLRNFVAVTPESDRGHEILSRAFVRTIHAADLACREATVPLHPQQSLEAWLATNRLIAECIDASPKPVGLYVANEYLSRLVLQACRERGLRVPADVALVCGQNEETVCEHMQPTLTSIDLGFRKVGYEAARLLHRLMDGEPPPRQPVLVTSPGIVVRESTDFVAVANPKVAAALAFIAANSQKPIGQDDVARGIGAETRTLQNYFRKHLGRPIVAEIRRVRIERAKRELAESTRSLKEIAEDVGFGTATRMYEVFRREVGMTPSAYREQRRPLANENGRLREPEKSHLTNLVK
jgi:LacI family transcriptional regulator